MHMIYGHCLQNFLSLKIHNQHVQFDNNLSAFSMESSLASSLQCILSIALYCFFYRSRLASLQVRMEASTFKNNHGDPPIISVNIQVK